MTEIYLQNEISTSFTKLYSLHIYEEQIRKHFFSHFTVIWSADMQILIFKKNVLRIANLNSMMQQLIINIKNFLCEQLIFQNHKYLKTKQLCRLTDDWTWHRIGNSLMNVMQSHNHLQHENKYLILYSILYNNKNYQLFMKTNNFLHLIFLINFDIIQVFFFYMCVYVCDSQSFKFLVNF